MEVAVDHVLGPIGQIHITVSDVDASVAFYRDVLGMRHLFTVPGQPMAFFDAGGVRLYLGEVENPRFRSRPTIYYRVDDVATAFAAVVGRGATPLEEPRVVHRDGSTELWMAFVEDPDGIPVGMMAEVSAN